MTDHEITRCGVLYLDVDGVIISDNPPFKDKREVFLDGKTSDTLAHRLGATGLDLRWLTSWEENILDKAEKDFDRGLRGGSAFSRSNEDRSLWKGNWMEWKVNTILADQAINPRPFVWVDDNITDKENEHVLSLTSTPSLIIVPESKAGISPGELLQIEAFAENYSLKV